MKLTLKRVQLDPDVTIGELSIDGLFYCYTCEDVVRPPGAPKVFGDTAIPAGEYMVDVTYSPHFGRELPLLSAVPNFSGVRIHPGNTPADTEGCLLVGFDRHPKGVGRSRDAFGPLFARLNAAHAAGEDVTIEISA